MGSSGWEAIFRAPLPTLASSTSRFVSCCWRDGPQAHLGEAQCWDACAVGCCPGSQGARRAVTAPRSPNVSR